MVDVPERFYGCGESTLQQQRCRQISGQQECELYGCGLPLILWLLWNYSPNWNCQYGHYYYLKDKLHDWQPTIWYRQFANGAKGCRFSKTSAVTNRLLFWYHGVAVQCRIFMHLLRQLWYWQCRIALRGGKGVDLARHLYFVVDNGEPKTWTELIGGVLAAENFVIEGALYECNVKPGSIFIKMQTAFSYEYCLS